LVLLAVLLTSSLAGQTYSAATLTSAAHPRARLAPNAFATLYGTNLSFVTRGLVPEDVRGGALPTTLPGTGVTVSVAGQLANVWYASPGQVNFLIPPNLEPGRVRIRLNRDGRQGPEIEAALEGSAPALFQIDPEYVIAARLDRSVVTAENPARPGEDIVLFATGAGVTVPPAPYGRLADRAAPLARASEFGVWLDGVAVDGSAIRYAGVAPGFAGLYQINLKLPETAGLNPEIRIGSAAAMSPAGPRLRVGPTVSASLIRIPWDRRPDGPFPSSRAWRSVR